VTTISVENVKNKDVERTVVGQGVTYEQHATNERYQRLSTSIPAVEVASLDTIAVGQRLGPFGQLAVEFDERL